MVKLSFYALTLFFGVMGCREFLQTAQFADLFLSEQALLPEDSTNAAEIGRLANQAADVVSTGACRSDILDAGLNFIMRDLDLQDPIQHYDDWSKSVARADVFIQHALACSPANGDYWVRLAMVRRAAGENPGELSLLMSKSVALAPSEISVLRARFSVWRRASATTLALSNDVLTRDLRTLLDHATPKEITDILGGAPPNLQLALAIALRATSSSRRALLEKEHVKLL